MSSKKEIICPACSARTEVFRNPAPTADVIIELADDAKQPKIVLISRKNPPYGWAIPGGFVDYGESVETAAIREAWEETGLNIRISYLLGVYSDPERDPRQHTISTVFVGRSDGEPRAGDDAAQIGIFALDEIPVELAFDHSRIIQDYLKRYTSQIRTAESS